MMASAESGAFADTRGFDPLSAVQQYGHNTHSFLSLYPGIRHFHLPGVEGYIPYVTSGRLTLVAGEPVCPSSSLGTLIQGLMRQAQSKGHRIGMIPVSEVMNEQLKKLGFDSLYIGKEPIFNLQHLPQPSASIRRAARRAARKGLRIVPFHESYCSQIEAISHQWSETRELPPMSFLFQLRPMTLQEYKRYFLLVDESDHLLAFLACSPVYGRKGWYLEDLIRVDAMPNGGTELLMQTALDTFAAEGYEMATLALAPLAGLPDRDEQHPILNQLLRLCYEHLSFMYHFQTLEYFKSKFQPSVWEPNYFCFYPKRIRFSLIQALLSAFMPASLPEMIVHKLQQVRQKLMEPWRKSTEKLDDDKSDSCET
jgi:phosphatidylglycerol lysyltransferase